MQAGPIFVGVGGWDYEPWRETFYPPGLPKSRQLEHAASLLTATEINATHYKLQKPETFERWAAAVPDGFKFAVKASRFCTNRKVLCEGGEGVAKFCAQGLTALGDKLGPILWQFMGTKKFDPDDFGGFLQLLPRTQDGVPLRHVVEPRHDSFKTAEFVEMARAADVGIVFADAEDYPLIATAAAASSMPACSARKRSSRTAIRRRRSTIGRIRPGLGARREPARLSISRRAATSCAPRDVPVLHLRGQGAQSARRPRADRAAMNPLFAQLPTSIFARMSGLAAEHEAVNLGQGFPDFGWPEDVVERAATLLLEATNQYPPMRGLPELRQAVVDHYRKHQDVEYAVEDVTVTSGATEALAAAILPWSRLVTRCCCSSRFTTPTCRWCAGQGRAEAGHADAARLAHRSGCDRGGDRAEHALVIFNNPQNPTARLFDETELAAVADACVRHDLIMLSDECGSTSCSTAARIGRSRASRAWPSAR
jgi:uncharacterized protein YecE (DUF72 family)